MRICSSAGIVPMPFQRAAAACGVRRADAQEPIVPMLAAPGPVAKGDSHGNERAFAASAYGSWLRSEFARVARLHALQGRYAAERAVEAHHTSQAALFHDGNMKLSAKE